MDKLKLQYLLLFWFIVGIFFAVIYQLFPGYLIETGKITYSFLDSLYFSFVTMLTIWYGDVIPVGSIRIVAILEGLIGWIIFGVIVYKIVSVKEDVILEEMHKMSNEEYISRVRHYLFVSNTNISRFINHLKTKKKIEKSDIYELSLISTTLEANIADARRFLCRERLAFVESITEEDIMLILKNIDLCLSNLISALNLLPHQTKNDAVIYDNIKKIVEYNSRIYGFCNVHVSNKKIDELKNLTESLDKYLKSMA